MNVKDLYKFTGLPFQEAREKVAHDLVRQIFAGEIQFPFQYLFTKTPRVLFNNLKKFYRTGEKKDYTLKSYYPRVGLYLPPKFRGEQMVVCSDKDDYYEMDVLSDHFVEEIRLKARRSDQALSTFQCWYDLAILRAIVDEALKSEYITYKSLRQALYKICPETKTFRPTWALGLLYTVMGKEIVKNGIKWLDISAGWGDRLLAAMSINSEYLGYDPNIALKMAHNAMITMFGSEKQKVIYEPFEESITPEEYYDVVLSSPPYYNVEIYSKDPTQSIIKYPTFCSWIKNFLFVSLRKAWKSLKYESYLILHIGDNRSVKFCEATNLFIEETLENSSFEGILGLEGEAKIARPCWVWKKTKNPVRWKPEIPRKLANLYPELVIN